MDASFYMHKNEFFKSNTEDGGVDYYSFYSINYDMHISHRGYVLKIDVARDSELHKNDATFTLEELVEGDD